MKIYKAFINRTDHPNYTSGIFTLYENTDVIFECFTLELPWNSNEIGKSCIPKGEYECVMDNTGKHQYFKVLGVPNRQFIEIHPANKVSDLGGCIALGSGCNYALDKGWYVLTGSHTALDYLRNFGIKKFILTIV